MKNEREEAQQLHPIHQEFMPEQFPRQSITTEDIEIVDLDFNVKHVKMMACFIFLLDVLINVDHGAVPSALGILQTDLNLENVQLGSLGSLVFIGLLFGSLVATFVLNKYPYKTVLGVSFLGNGIGLLLFTFTRSFPLLCCSRFLSGFFQIFLTIYIPLYVDTFGTKQTKPIMLSLILLAPPIGVVVGYSITGICISSNASWRSSFVLQGVAMALSFICLQIIPDSFINIDQVNMLKRREKNKRLSRDVDLDSGGSLVQGEMGGTKVAKSQQQTPEIESKKIEFKNIIKMEKRDIVESAASFSEEPQSAKRQFVKLLGNGGFVCTTLALSVLFFIVSGIQMWVSDYFVEVIGASQATTHIYFALVCVTAPVLGAVLSGTVASRFGGFKSSKAMESVIMAAIVAMGAAIPIPYFDDFYIVVTLIWILLFAGGFILPILTGIMLNTVDVFDRPQANSIANLCYNLFGYCPSPAIYGAVCTLYGGRKSRAGMKVLTLMSLVNFIFIIMGHFYIKRQNTKNKTLDEIEPKFQSLTPLGEEDTRIKQTSLRLSPRKPLNSIIQEEKFRRLSHSSSLVGIGWTSPIHSYRGDVLISNLFVRPSADDPQTEREFVKTSEFNIQEGDYQ